MSADLAAKGRAILETLVGFDTTSRLSNLALIEWVEEYLSGFGITGRRVPNADGTKANFYATVGPDVEGGVILSGHSDVVPIDGQDWSSDPWTVTERDGRLHGRGTSDMKAFIALALAAVPRFQEGKRPVHIALSYDEEVGCKGAPDLIASIADHVPAPALAIVGEPTSMAVVTGHKGIALHEVRVRGHEAHSSLTHLGVSANMVAIGLMGELAALAEGLKGRADPDSPFTPPHATLTVGMMSGGTASNILARDARFVFDLRCPPGQDPLEILAPFMERIAAVDAELKARFPECGVSVERLSHTPPLAPVPDGPAEAFVRSLTGDNGPALAVSYAAEAGQFARAGFATVLCGPGSIEQAHQPDEWITLEQIDRGAAFMERLAARLKE
ncbi:acetylornithine deacetylase [Novosphingopyxis sp. YJ-S2-01]|uniref:acetylornithine deacetylase n=1 Tax=Novosphingopyxis sp. YJ-S2-01 TaxID=2794021 RepID=UPI0018DBE15F|nr:acetylornithine deacetylase [Novosphingopyxis sp. YJ-S2-01]MBH9536886.1 acetylornithine deacetylase [Novosphingopyxis sp. YJ-S2-01]